MPRLSPAAFGVSMIALVITAFLLIWLDAGYFFAVVAGAVVALIGYVLTAALRG